MLLNQIFAAICILVFFRIFFWPVSKNWLLFVLSLIAIFWFQTSSPIRTLIFWLPTIILVLSTVIWMLLDLREKSIITEDIIALIIILIFPFLFGLLKFIGLSEISFITNTPRFLYLLLIPGILFLCLYLIGKRTINQSLLSGLLISGLVIFLIILKSKALSQYMSAILRQLNGQSIALASSVDIVWVGFSYFAFRLIHILVDRERIKKLDLSLRDFVTYLIFFPAFTAGPIDRIERFSGELTKVDKKSLNEDFIEGGLRIIRGLFQKFILADSLALISLNTHTANSVNMAGWMWLVLYAYAFRIFFDFSGYTDIAIGIARLAGITLPENFKRPYLSKNISIFWNNWHITMTQWFRTYYFNPITRFIRSNYKNISPVLIIFFTQTTTMVLIGLWHGINWNFVIWGLWNGIGLFIHNRWSEKIKPRLSFFQDKRLLVPYDIVSVIFTFNFVALGWVWFSLPSINESLLVFSKLF
ncbi:MAG: MBOAT family O-acyltransferase [Pelolinea sp.]|nr:MBOAT family O-acyltransferase [Pelolinea sp.]